ncbi:hypothetical protein AB7C87_13315 [Natrarchaeobius sp. A-rgal3]|uniref:hypothetical protein n=1 Tax=Natrarchaeobius versutus TaxID=1679078 RepID=UPI00350F04B3
MEDEREQSEKATLEMTEQDLHRIVQDAVENAMLNLVIFALVLGFAAILIWYGGQMALTMADPFSTLLGIAQVLLGFGLMIWISKK